MDEDHADFEDAVSYEPSWIELRSVKPLRQVRKITSQRRHARAALPPPHRNAESSPPRHDAPQRACDCARRGRTDRLMMFCPVACRWRRAGRMHSGNDSGGIPLRLGTTRRRTSHVERRQQGGIEPPTASRDSGPAPPATAAQMRAIEIARNPVRYRASARHRATSTD
jgi:hypothetical protein